MELKTARSRFYRIAIRSAIALAIGLVAWRFVFLWNRQRNDGIRLKATSSLTHINVGIQTYAYEYGSFPPAYWVDRHGNRHSWRVLILEAYNPELYAEYSFDEAWDGPNNSKLLHRMPPYYGNYAKGDDLPYHTRFVVITGKGCAFDGPQATRQEDISDDLETTLMVVESSMSVPWMAPIDLPFEQMSFRVNDQVAPSIATNREGEPVALFLNGFARRLPPSLTERDIRALATIRGGERIDPDSLKRLD